MTEDILTESDIPQYNFRMTEGDALSKSIQFRDEDTDILESHTGSLITMKIRAELDDEEALLTMTTTDGSVTFSNAEDVTNAVITFTKSASAVKDAVTVPLVKRLGKMFPEYRLYYDIEETPSGGVKRTRMRGLFIFTAEASK